MIEHMWFANGVVRWFIGDASTEHYLVSNRHLLSDARFQDVAYVIDDFSDCTCLIDWDILPPEWSVRPAKHPALCRPGLRHAVVAPEAVFRDRVFRMAHKELPIAVAKKFSSMKKARAWLGDAQSCPTSALIQWQSSNPATVPVKWPACGRQVFRSGVRC